jgi:hypothetical protein
VTIAIDGRGKTYSAEAGGISGKLRCHAVCRELTSDGRAHYSIVIRNDTNAEAHVRAFVPQATPPYYRTVMQRTVAPFNEDTATIALPPTASGGTPEIHVALTNGDIQLLLAVSNLANEIIPEPPPRLEPVRTFAPPVVDVRSATRGSPPVAPILLFFTVLLSSFVAVVLRPQVAALRVPVSAAAGAAVPITFRATGLGVATYTVLSAEGQSIEAGSLAPGSSNVVLHLPSGSRAQTLLIRLQMSNLLGAAVAERYLHVLASPVASTPPRPRRASIDRAPGPPQIRSLAVDRATVTSGDTVNVSYAVRASSGSLSLIDPASQVIYGKATLDASGRAAFVAPFADTEHFLSVMLTVRRGDATTQSRIGVIVMPRSSPPPVVDHAAAAADVSSVPIDDMPPSTALAAARLIAPTLAHSGQAITIDVRNAGSGMQLIVLNDSGAELVRRHLAIGNSSEEFIAPTVRAPMRLIVEATYPTGDSNAAVIRTISLKP